MILDNIKEQIEKANSIVIVTHETPDGDAMGTCLAMYIALKRMGKEVDVIIPEYPKMYDFLPCITEIKKEKTKEKYDLAISLDCSDIKRLNGFSDCFENAKVRIVIDHHGSNTMFGDYNFVNPVSPACSEILIVVLQYIGANIDKEIGTCLLTGIITDTGGFKYANVTAETFEFVAELLKKGVNVSLVYKNSLQILSKSSFELRKIATQKIEFLEEDKIAFTYITKEEMQQVGATIGEHDGIVEIGRDVKGVEVSIFLRETDEGYKASLRSNGNMNVADICLLLGGGGHPNAAGCTLNFPFDQAKEKILAHVKRYL